jgi:hypothetical protein
MIPHLQHTLARTLLQVKKVKEYMKDSSFTYEGLRSISIAGAGLLKWVLAMVNYNNVARTVEPKRKKVADSEKNLRIAQVSACTVHQGLLAARKG